ncbi:MAG: phosphatidate cytidylyltransferase [Bacteroidetes bacterium]|nr:phosphatidate cytidylyltransferase [Bacteroidota bacterium]MBT5992493.1 phosphatidate cytidylyltransferase [Bacteroidota bacterium]
MIRQLIIITLLLFGVSGILFGLEILHKKFAINPEYTRKSGHVIGTLASLILLYTLDSHWYVLGLELSIFFILFIGKLKGTFKAIENVNRKSSGSYLLPVSIYILFLVSSKFQNNLFFILPIFLLGISDPLAGLVGILFKAKSRKIKLFSFAFNKTILGSTTFFVSSLILSLITLFAFGFSWQQVILISVLVSSVSTLTELVSPKGIDNLTVPLVSLIVLLITIQ